MTGTIVKRTLLIVMISVLCISLAYAEDVISGKFDLVDHDGQPVTERSYEGKLRLVFFGFTRCPDVCPTTLLEIRNALHQLGDDAEQVQALFVSVDHGYDSPRQLADYVAAFHPSLVGLTGTVEQIDAAANSFNVTYGIKTAEESANGREEIFHSAYVFLMGRDGEFIDVLGYGTRASRMVEVLRDFL